jgi:hypothetical protein
MSSIKHQRVRDDWNKFAPTNAVNQSQLGLTQWANARLINTKLPAINRIHRSIAIVILSCRFEAFGILRSRMPLENFANPESQMSINQPRAYLLPNRCIQNAHYGFYRI